MGYFFRRTSWITLAGSMSAAACGEQVHESTGAAQLQLEPAVVLGSATDSISISGFADVVELASGDFIVVGLPFPRDRVLHYSASGQLLGIIGRPGDGPGEFRHITSLYRSGDSAVVFELTGKISSISADLSVQQLGTVPGLLQRGWVSPWGELLVMGSIPGPANAPVYRFSGSRFIGTLGVADAPRGTNRTSRAQRHVAFTADGNTWLVRPDRYELELYDSAGTLLQVLDQNRPWFPDRDYQVSEPPAPPAPFIIGLAVDSLERILVLARVANEPFDSDLPRGEGVRLTPDYMKRLYDGIIEVIDPETNTAVVSLRSDVPFEGFASSEKVYALREDHDGTVAVDVWNLRVRMPH